MAASVCNIDVIPTDGEVPRCSHGPTLLFAKYGGGSGGRRFFACSAFRDKKECSFFQWQDDNVSEEKIRARGEINQRLQPPFTHKQYWKRFLKSKKLAKHDRSFCQLCGLLLMPEERHEHQGEGHSIISPIAKTMLATPTHLFTPLDNNKTYAQYLFAQSAMDFTVRTLTDLNYTHILCIGCPRIHEVIQARPTSDHKLQSLLMDLDHRYFQMYPPATFCRYNMFNHHFFDDPEAEAVYRGFIREDHGKRVAVVMDPPFGGMVEVLASTLSKIHKAWQDASPHESENEGISSLPVLWFFPYFMEKRIVDCCPNFHMLDYKVDYDNHALFTGTTKGRKQGSPVRIFTNIPARMVKLPQEDGYWFCAKCQQYSSPENRHCDICQACTSKDGTTYKHCDKCRRCVKPSRIHCDTCKSCEQQDHRCGQSKGSGCHICGALDHKRRECPNKPATTTSITQSQCRGQKRVKKQNKHKSKKAKCS